MASRTPPRGRTGGRAPLPSRSAPKSNPMPLILGGVGLLVVVVLLVVMNQGGGNKAATPAPKPAAPAAKPAHVPAPTAVAPGAAKAGKTPGRPAPPLTQDVMQKAAGLIDEAKVLFNDGVKLRTAGDNTGARAKQSSAKDKLDEAKAMLALPLRWQEEADLDDWAMPAEYAALGKLYGDLSSLEKKVRMSGGT